MSVGDDDLGDNEYLDLPDDPETAFAALHRRKYNDLETAWANSQGDSSWHYERRYVDFLLAFDEVHNLDVLKNFRSPPIRDSEFGEFFQSFRRHAEVSSQKILMEAARRVKTGAQQVVVLDTGARHKIHVLISSIRERLNELTLPEAKRDSLFNKLNAFASEVDRNRTRTEAFLAFSVESARTGREVLDEIKPLQDAINGVLDIIDKAKSLKEMLPSWAERKRIEGPPKQLPSPKSDPDEDLPF